MIKTVLAAVAVAVFASQAQAVTVVQWNFNSVVPDANTGTGSTAPNIGTGTASLVGGATAGFASGDANGGSTDPAVGDDTRWNLATFPAQGTGDKTAGAQFMVSTVGYTDVILTWDQTQSNTASKYSQVLYTVNGTTFADAPIGLFLVAAGGVFDNNRTVSFLGIPGVANNPNFGVRIVSTFRPSTTAYDPSTPTSAYGTAGTYGLDMVTISATAAVPEVGTLGMMLAGLAGIGFLAYRRRTAA